MAEFLPNLDDGELWLPSDIFPLDEIVPAEFNPKRCYNPSSDLPYVGDLSLLERHKAQSFSKPQPSLKLFKPPVPYAAGLFPGSSYISTNSGGDVAHGIDGSRTGLVWNASGPVPRFEFMNPFYCQLQQHQFLQNHVLGNRFSKIQRCCAAGNGGGYGGTGVFLPRTTTAATSTRTHKGAGTSRPGRKRNSNRLKTSQLVSQTNSPPMKKMADDVGMEDQCFYEHLPPEIGLPQDWTY